MRNKKASIGATLTWIVGIIVLAFGLAILLLFAAGLFISKAGKISEQRNGVIGNTVLSSNKLTGFLEDSVDGIKVKDLIDGNPEENQKNFINFQDKARVFLKDNFNHEDYEIVWIRVYGINEQAEQNPTGKYDNFEAKTPYSSRSITCDPTVVINNAASNLKTLPDIIYLEFPIKDKKIALCAQYKVK